MLAPKWNAWFCLVLSALPAAAAPADAWLDEPGYRHRALAPLPQSSATPGFTLLPGEATGLAFTNRLSTPRYVTNQIYLNGSGVALGDVDGDGRCDVFLPAIEGPNALFLNLGNWRFTNITDRAGVALFDLACTGAALADLDGDDDLDLAINTVAGGTHLLLNDGNARFTPARGSPFNPGRGGMSLALADTDGDGDLDIFIANYRSDTFRDQPGTRFRGRNVGGQMILQTVNGRPVTEPDLVGRYTIHPSGAIEEHGEPNLFLRNDGGGRFTPVDLTDGLFLDPQGNPIPQPPYDWTLSVLFADLNGDHAPDLYLCNDFNSPDELWWNDRSGRFIRCTPLTLRHTPMFSMGVDLADLNHDGHADFIVADMLGRTHAKRHTQLGDVRPQFSSQGQIENRPQYAFNQLFLNRGDGTFAEIGNFAHVTATDWTWNPMFMDVDLDGMDDLLFATGHQLEMMDADIGERAQNTRRNPRLTTLEIQRLKLLFPRHDIPNVAFRNTGSLRFSDATDSWRFGLRSVTTGMAAADLDDDGDLDLVLNNLEDPALLLRNDTSAPRLLVRLRGAPPNTRAIGATVRVTGGPVPQSREIISGGRYLSSDDTVRTFATGSSQQLRIEVTWRSGRTSVVADARPGRIYLIDEAAASEPPPRPSPPPSTAPLFTDATAELNHSHHETPFDDFARQPLLHARLSQLGPGVACLDLDSDHRDDLVIGSGAGGAAAIFRNREGRLVPWSTVPTPRDVLGLAAWPRVASVPPTAEDTPATAPAPDDHRALEILMASANWEDGSTNGPAVVRVAPELGEIHPLLPGAVPSQGPLATADFDGDGDLDLFVGARALPGRYPEPANSQLFINDAGRLKPHPLDLGADASGNTASSGMISAATWADLDDDGFPELILSADWGPPRIFRNVQGRLSSWDPPVRITTDDDHLLSTDPSGPQPSRPRFTRLSELTGCWTGVAAIDLDEDTRIDLVLGNWGLNSPWQLQSPHRPLRLYHADFDQNGTTEILEAAFVPELGADAPLRHLPAVAAALPFVRAVVTTHAAFSRATVSHLLGDRFAETRQVEAATFASIALLHRGDHMELHPLPAEAQWAPAFAVVPADFNGDAHMDLFLSQNFFAVHGEAPRQDAGRGLILIGDGTGRLRPLTGQESGIRIYGEQRGAACADFDADGRIDLVVSQNAAATRLFQNRGAQPGLRIRLAGPQGNPCGVGARVRLKSSEGLGPTQIVDGGSGWLSQNSPILVIGVTGTPLEVQVRWPGGTLTRTKVPSGATEVVANFSD